MCGIASRRSTTRFFRIPPRSEVDRIQSCEDFRALIPAYLTASLTPSRRLLFEDHVRECVSCRKAQEAAKRGASGDICAASVCAGSSRCFD